jgi:hypothetical protein
VHAGAFNDGAMRRRERKSKVRLEKAAPSHFLIHRGARVHRSWACVSSRRTFWRLICAADRGRTTPFAALKGWRITTIAVICV